MGQASETIDVTSAPPLLHTDTTQLSTVIDSHTNVDLPLLSRNYIQLALLAPGSVHPDPQTLTSGDGPSGAGRPYINGNREQANNFLLDGMDNNQVSDNLVGFTPSVDAIQEFSLITQNASAEFGNFQGGVVSTSIKSGTNRYHGDIFEFFRNDVLNANNWANNFQGLAEARASLEHVWRYVWRSRREEQVVRFRRLPGTAVRPPVFEQPHYAFHRSGTARRFLSVADRARHPAL